MAEYTDQQIKAVLDLQELHEVPGHLNPEACKQYLDWHMTTCTAESRGITSIAEAKASGLSEGLTIHEMQFRKLSELANSFI